MTEDAAAPARQRARQLAAATLEASPWADASTRASLLLTSPPRAPWLTAEIAEAARPAAWLVLHAADARLLPPAHRETLLRTGVLLEEHADLDLAVFVAEAVDGLLEGVSRRALEARWTLTHCESLHDPLHRLDSLTRTASAVPSTADERILRPLYVQAVEALHSLAPASLSAAGEAAASVCRLACVLEGGLHPPVQWLELEARGTALGARLGRWLEDLARAASRDTAAAGRLAESRERLLRAVAGTLRQHVGAPDWLTTPRAYALRPPR